MHQQAIVLGNLQQKPYTYPLIKWGKSTDFPAKNQKKTLFFPSLSVTILKNCHFLSGKCNFRSTSMHDSTQGYPATSIRIRPLCRHFGVALHVVADA